MYPSRSRGRKILLQAIQNKENSSEPEAATSILNNLPTTTNHAYPANKENLGDNDYGDFSPASDDDTSKSSVRIFNFYCTRSAKYSSCRRRTNIKQYDNREMNQRSGNVDNNIAPTVDSNNQSTENVGNAIAVDIPPAADNIEKPKKNNKRVAYISRTLKDCGKEYASSSKTKHVFPAKFLK